MMKKTPKQYVVMYVGRPIENTGYFSTVGAVRKYLKARYKDNGAGLSFQAVYPVREETIYTV